MDLRKYVISVNLSVASDLWNRILTLPCSTNITAKELEYVAKTVKEVLEE